MQRLRLCHLLIDSFLLWKLFFSRNGYFNSNGIPRIIRPSRLPSRMKYFSKARRTSFPSTNNVVIAYSELRQRGAASPVNPPVATWQPRETGTATRVSMQHVEQPRSIKLSNGTRRLRYVFVILRQPTNNLLQWSEPYPFAPFVSQQSTCPVRLESIVCTLRNVRKRSPIYTIVTRLQREIVPV